MMLQTYTLGILENQSRDCLLYSKKLNADPHALYSLMR